MLDMVSQSPSAIHLVLTEFLSGNSFCQLYRRTRFIVLCQDQVGRQVEYVLK
jgi:hypothetical protein